MTTTLTTLTTTTTTTTVIIIMMLELFAPHVSYVFGTNMNILTCSAITVGLVLATMDTRIMLLYNYTHCRVIHTALFVTLICQWMRYMLVRCMNNHVQSTPVHSPAQS